MHKYNPENTLFFNWIKKDNKQCLLDISAFAKFDEIQALPVQVFRKTQTQELAPSPYFLLL